MYLELFNKKLIAELAKNINEKNGNSNEEPSPEYVFNNLDKIYEEEEKIEFGQKTGEKTKYMPKQYKEMVMRLISPTYSILTNVEWFDDHVTANANLFLDRMDTKPISTAKSCYYFERMDSNLSEAEKRSTAELAARGYAESKCLQKFGIGAWFKGSVDAEDNPDRVKIENKSGGQFEPVVITEEENKNTITNNETSSQLNNSIPSEVSDESEQINFFNFMSEQTENKEPSSQNTSTISYDKALSIMVDIGKAAEKGYNLGDVIKKTPRHLVWLYKNGCGEEVKNAINVIINTNDDIKALFAEENLL